MDLMRNEINRVNTVLAATGKTTSMGRMEFRWDHFTLFMQLLWFRLLSLKKYLGSL